MEKKSRRRKNRARRAARAVAVVALIAVAAFCFLYCLDSLLMHRRAEAEYGDIQEEYVIPAEGGDDEAESASFAIDWDALLAENPETVGWIWLNEGCSYPVVRHDDNSYYLSHSSSGAESVNGAIFMSAANSPDWSDRNTVVYGHNMNNGSMFGSNRLYRDEAYVQEHPCFYVYTPDGACRTYRIFSVMQVEDASRTYDTSVRTDGEFEAYIQDTAPLWLFGTGAELRSGDSIVTLSTCAKHNTDQRLVIQGVLAEGP